MPSIRITNTSVSKIKLPPNGKREFYWDEELKGFGVKASSIGLTYIVQKRVGGGRGSTLVRHVIGSVREKDASAARDEARTALSDLRDGINLNEEKRKEAKKRELKGITLSQAYAEFKASKDLRPRTVQTYDENIKRTLNDWLDLPLTAIKPEMVLKKHKEISTAGRNGRGIASANQAMRLLRVIFNYVMATRTDGNGQPTIEKNPVGILNQLESWNALEERDTIVHADDLKVWYQAVMQVDSDKLQDFFLFLMFTGLRRNEAMQLRWENFDTKTETLTIPKEISKSKRTRKIPLTDALLDIYRKRRQKIVLGNPYVFQGRHGKGHLTEPKSGVLTVREKSGINWSSHDLRRSYVTLANKLDISAYKVKFLVGHSVSGDVTGKHYSKLTVDDVRDAAQEIADFLKEKMGMKMGSLEEVG